MNKPLLEIANVLRGGFPDYVDEFGPLQPERKGKTGRSLVRPYYATNGKRPDPLSGLRGRTS